MLNLLRENCSFDFEVIYTLCTTAQISFRMKSDGLKLIKKDPEFKKICGMGRNLKNGVSFNITAISNSMNWHPLESISRLNRLALRYNGFLIKSGYSIYLKIDSSSKDENLDMPTIYEKMLEVLKATVHGNLERKLRRLDIFYYILDQALKKYPSSHQTEERSKSIQGDIEKYFNMDELDYVKTEIGWDRLTRCLPLEFLPLQGNKFGSINKSQDHESKTK